MHEVLVNRLGGLSLPRKSVVRLTDRPDMTMFTVDVKQPNNNILFNKRHQKYVEILFIEDLKLLTENLKYLESLFIEFMRRL